MHGTNPQKLKPATRKKGLSLRTIETLVQAAKPGMWVHERGLCLAIAKSGTAFWALRYSTKSGQRRLMTLEAYEAIDTAKLKALEWQVAEFRKQIRVGRDPLAERNAVSTSAVAKTTRATDTFENVALDYIAQHKDGWKNYKHRTQWENSLTTYVYPIIGSLPPHKISTDDVLKVLQQKHKRRGIEGTLWTDVRETASRVRTRIETVIASAKAKGLSNGETKHLWTDHHNPAQWQNNLRYMLNGKRSRFHFKAMDWNEVPAFAKELQQKSDYSAKALMLTILCAVRTNETINATWPEFDLENKIWVIPANRMKAGVEHRVPLSSVAIDLLTNLHRIDGNPHVFPGTKRNRPLCTTAMLQILRAMRDDYCAVHGFRSTFRDWASETTLHPDTIVEMALAHAIKNQTERAYRRGDAFERRKALMQQWCDYLLNDHQSYRTNWEKLVA